MSTIKLSEPVKLPEQYRETVLAFLHDYWDMRMWEMRNHFGIEFDIQDMPNTDDDYLRLMIADPISQMTHVAAGQTKGFDRGEVYEGIQGLVEKLFGVPGESSYTIPQEFWQSPFGSMVMAAFVWSQGDKLINLSDAATLSGKSVKSISQYVARGKLQSYPDMSEPNPQRRMRVLKSEVKALR